MNEEENVNTTAEVERDRTRLYCIFRDVLETHALRAERSFPQYCCQGLFALISEVKLLALPGVRDGNCPWLIGSSQQLNPLLNTLCNCCCTQGSSPHHMSVKLSFTITKESQPCAREGDRTLLERLSPIFSQLLQLLSGQHSSPRGGHFL